MIKTLQIILDLKEFLYNLLVLNNSVENIHYKQKLGALLENLSDFNVALIEKFEEDKSITYDKDNDNHKFQLNEFLKDNFEDWLNEYTILLSKYNMEVTFINAKKYNID